MDFSPLFALMVLMVAFQITGQIIIAEFISIGIVLALIVGAMWSALSWIFTFFLILVVIRLITYLLDVNSVSPFVHTIDIIIQPLLQWIAKKFLKNKALDYQNGLILTGALILTILLIGNLLMNDLITLISKLPI